MITDRGDQRNRSGRDRFENESIVPFPRPNLPLADANTPTVDGGVGLYA
ncbi:hypothetical protein [Halostagnicola bangensis]